MQTDRARQIDLALTPVSYAFGAVRRALGARPAEVMTASRALPCARGGSTAVVKLAGLGSIAIIAPVLKAYAEAMAPVPQYFVTQEENRAFIELLDLGLETMYIRTGSLGETAGAALTTVKQLRRLGLAGIVDLEFYSRATTFFSFLTASPVRIAFAEAPWRRHIVTHSVPWNPRWHFARVTAHILGQLAGAALDPPVDLPLRPGVLGDSPVARDPERKLVCVNVNAGVLCLERRLPLAHFAGLLRYLADATAVKLCFIGARSETEYVEQAIKLVGDKAPCVNMAGKTPLPQLLSLIKASDLLITNDTGPLHFAVGLGTPTLSFFGPEDPARFGPRQGPHLMVHGDVVCSPCFNERNLKSASCAGRNVCLSGLAPAELGQLAAELLASLPSAPRIVHPHVALEAHCGS